MTAAPLVINERLNNLLTICSICPFPTFVNRVLKNIFPPGGEGAQTHGAARPPRAAPLLFTARPAGLTEMACGYKKTTLDCECSSVEDLRWRRSPLAGNGTVFVKDQVIQVRCIVMDTPNHIDSSFLSGFGNSIALRRRNCNRESMKVM